MKVKIIREVYSQKQRKFFCASDDPKLKAMCDDPMKEEQLEEMTSMGGSAVAGAVGAQGGPWVTEKDEVEKFNKKEKEISKLKETPLEEMYSSQGTFQTGMELSGDTFAGFAERSAHQGLQNVPKPKKKFIIRIKRKKNNKLSENSSTADSLIKFALIGQIKRKREALYPEFLEQYGIDKLTKAVLEDNTAPGRISFMASHQGSSSELLTRIEEGDSQALKDYYDFLINEYLFWSYYNPHASPIRLARNAIKVGSEAKNLIRAHIYRYINDPSVNNPKSLQQRAIGKQSSSQKVYGEKPTLDPALYDLPE
tara:strand:- start:2816 stop:3745 length:930 start_codon:yes stop_codon:yes gene_type:complete